MAEPHALLLTDLSSVAWLGDPALLAVAHALGAADGLTRLVGGAVRDGLLGLPVADIDLATRLLPDTVVERLRAAGLKAVPTGLAHGTITAVSAGRGFEVTTLRRDVETDGRHARIAYTDDWAEDAARRDFTINALYADPLSGALFDPVGGLADLAARRVRFIGDAAARIDEDHLRILRWFRFSARFGDGAGGDDAQTLSLIAARARLMRALSRERIADELLRILALPRAAAAAQRMRGCGILFEIAPELDDAAAVDRLERMIAREGAAGLPPDAVRRLMALLPPDPAVADSIAARLRLANRVRKRIACALGGAAEAPVRPLACRIGMEGARDRWLLSAHDLAGLAPLDGWTPPALPVSGRDVLDRGVSAGPDVSRLLHRLADAWIAADFPPRGEALALLDAIIGEGGDTSLH